MAKIDLSIPIIDIYGNVHKGLKYAILEEGELLLGFKDKNAADRFEIAMPHNSYNRMSDTKISIKF